MALQTGDAQRRNQGNYFVAAVLSASRGRSCGQILLSGATAELLADHVPDGADRIGLGAHRLRDLGR